MSAPGRRRRAEPPKPRRLITRRRKFTGKNGVLAPGGGSTAFVPVPLEWRGTTRQVCGLFPWGSPGQLPLEGAPIGRHQESRAVVCFDHMSWFRSNRIANPSVLVIAKPGLGKALDLTTPIPTPNGWSSMAELGPGDVVFDERGRPTPIVAASEVMTDRECYELTFSDGSTVVADAEHLWVTTTEAQRSQRVEHAWWLRNGRNRRVGTSVDVAMVRGELAHCAPGTTTTRAKLARDLGWADDNRWSRVYQWAAAVPAVSTGRGAQYDRAAMLAEVLQRLERTVGSWQQLQHGNEPVTTRHIAETLMASGKHNHAVEVGGALELDPADLPIDPYVLGCWLGDGASAASVLTCADQGIVDEISRRGVEPRPSKTPLRYWLRPTEGRSVNELLRHIGVLDNKHVPASYLRASQAQRRDLLAGLLDTDGTVGVGGIVQFDNTNHQLVDQVHELASSLGYRCTVREGRATLDGRDCGPKWTVQFTPATSPFRLQRKSDVFAARYRGNGTRTRYRYITKAERVRSRPVRCIQVANDSGMFLAGRSMVPTHNSTLASKIMLWLAAEGYTLLIPGDTKPDYVELTRQLDGEHRVVARSGGAALNPCDPGGMAAAARRLAAAGRDAAAATLLAEAIGRATVCVSTLVELSRRGPVADYEEAAIAACLRMLYASPAAADGAEPLLQDVLRLLAERPTEVRAVVLDHGSDTAYDGLVDPLQRSLHALLDGQFGDVFARPVERRGGESRRSVLNIDTNRIKGGDRRFLGAVMVAAWSDMYGLVEADQALADEGLAPRPLYCLTLDELWRVLRLGGTMPDRVNEITRLNRTQGVGQIMITHSIRDLAPGKNNEIEGIEERAGSIVIGGVPKKELIALGEVVSLTGAEQSRLREWWSTSTASLDRNEVPPGAGKFLIKSSSEEPGIPVDVILTSAEKSWGGQDTNKVWKAS